MARSIGYLFDLRTGVRASIWSTQKLDTNIWPILPEAGKGVEDDIRTVYGYTDCRFEY
jgi:hypothetical protein